MARAEEDLSDACEALGPPTGRHHIELAPTVPWRTRHKAAAGARDLIGKGGTLAECVGAHPS
jgi:hypothetical protein